MTACLFEVGQSDPEPWGQIQGHIQGQIQCQMDDQAS